VEVVSIRLKRTVTAARLAANRRSALKSTGPRTEVGKRHSILNALRTGSRSKANGLFWRVLMSAPVGEVLETAERLMRREPYSHYEDLSELSPSPAPMKTKFVAEKLKLNQKRIRSKPKTPLLSTRPKNKAVRLQILNNLPA
jgi:hypothetical protein